MYLFKNQATLEVADADILETIKLLTRFFVRRNITDTPNTRDLNKIFMQIISDVEEGKLTGTAIYQHIYDELVRWSATDELFEEKLKGDIYDAYVGLVLCALHDIGRQAGKHELDGHVACLARQGAHAAASVDLAHAAFAQGLRGGVELVVVAFAFFFLSL